MSESLVEKNVAVKLESTVPLRVVDEQGRVVGSAMLAGVVNISVLLDKHHPAAFDLETENGLARLKLSAGITDNTVLGILTIGV